MEGGPTSIGPKTWDRKLEVEEVHVRVKAASVGPGPVGGCRGTNMHEAHEIAKTKGTCNGNKNIAGVDAKKRRAAVVNVTTSVIVRKKGPGENKIEKDLPFPYWPRKLPPPCRRERGRASYGATRAAFTFGRATAAVLPKGCSEASYGAIRSLQSQPRLCVTPDPATKGILKHPSPQSAPHYPQRSRAHSTRH